ncbi:hypothetical protein ACYRFT_00005, partial [Listeria kieliensis]
TNDSVNHQLIIEWKKNQEHKVVLGFTSSKPKTVSLQAVDDANNTSNSVSIVVQKEEKHAENPPFSNRAAYSMLEGLTPPDKSPYGTIMDAKGQYVSGKEVQKSREIIPLIHYGSISAARDITVNGGPPPFPQTFNRFPVGTVLKVNNVGFHNGEPCVLAIKTLLPNMSLDTFANFPMTMSAILDPVEFSVEIWLEDGNGNEIKDPGITILLPMQLRISTLSDGANRNVITQISDKSAVNNILARDATITGAGESFLDPIGNSYQFVSRERSKMDYNILYNASQHLRVSGSLRDNDGKLVPFKDHEDFLYYQRLFSSNSNDLVLMLPYTAPTIEPMKNEKTVKAEFNIGQSLITQNAAMYPDSFSVDFNMGDLVKNNQLYAIRVVDSSKKAVTSSKTFDAETNTFHAEFTKSTMSQLKNNELSITGSFDLNTDAPDLIDTFQPDGFFHIPIEAVNSDQPDLKVKGETLVKMPAPTATPVPQVVSLHSSPEELDPSDLVTDLKSILPQDKIKVIGIKQKEKFETLGSTTVDVVIESELTHVQGVITVPVEVETGSLSFESAPKSIDFGTVQIGPALVDVPVKETVNDLAVQDTRFLGKWELGVRVSKPLTGLVHKKPLGQLFYLTDDAKIPLSNQYQPVVGGGYTGRKEPFNVSGDWNEKHGLILEIKQGEALREKYQGVVIWSLRDVPA